jgi:pimeloyl-ACP methyl ester carboxylesterase
MYQLTPPRHDGTVLVRDGRELGFATYGSESGPTVLWFHGTPGARHQIPEDARVMAEEHGFRIVAVDRPGIGLSTSHLYRSILDAVPDIEILLDHLDVERFVVVGLSGGGPYALATAFSMPDRVTVAGILGGVAPHVGPDSIAGGLVGYLARTGPALPWVRRPLSQLLRGVVACAAPVGPQALWLYSRISPEGDRLVLEREEIKAMFLGDLMKNSRRRLGAPLNDLILFLRPWDFSVRDIRVPVRWWHGDADHIVPFEHGRHVVSLIPHAQLYVRHGESHLGGLGAAGEVLQTVLKF